MIGYNKSKDTEELYLGFCRVATLVCQTDFFGEELLFLYIFLMYLSQKQIILFRFTIYYTDNIDKKEVLNMSTTVVSFFMDEDLKENMEKVCAEMGLSMADAFTMFAKRVTRDKCIPFEISAVSSKQRKATI